MPAALHSLQREIEDLRDQLARSNARNVQLQELLHQALHREFGASTEKFSAEQARLFDELDGIDDDPVEASVQPTQVEGHERSKRGRPRLSADLPRVEVVHDLSDAEKICSVHDCELTPIGEVTSEELEFQPATLHVLKHIRKKYACPCCEGHIVTAAKPPSMIEKSIATPALLSWVVVSKYQDALPLYRQSLIFKRLGVSLDRTTLANWMMACGERVQPIVNLLWDRLREETVIHMDETTVQVLNEPDKTPQSKSYMWVSTAGPPDAGVVVFHYDRGRSGQVPKALLGDYQGTLMADGYEGYNSVCALNQLTRLGCWAHARRKFVAAQRQQPKGKTGAVDLAVAWIGKLYRIERANVEASNDERYRARQDTAVPILNQLHQWLEKTQPRTAPKTALGKALTYLANQWCYLERYVEDGCYPIDNNRAENAIRPFVIGRKNYLFSQSIRGVKANANLYTLIETAKAHGLDPHAYLLRVFKELPSATSLEDIEALLPQRLIPAV
jgi:transposase